MKNIIVLLCVLSASAFGQTLINGSRTIQGAVNYCSDAGANDTYACNLSPAIASYTSGACYTFKANTANTGAATINLNSVGAATIKKAAGGVATDLSDNDIRAGQIVTVCYDGTNMQIQSTLGNAAAVDPNTVTAAGTLTSNLPMIGGGSKAAAVGTRSGNTTEFATSTGSKTTGKQLEWDANGNIVASASDIGGGGGSAVALDWRGPRDRSGTWGDSKDVNQAAYATCNVVWNPVARTSYGIAFKVGTASGTCSGTCYFSVAYYNSSKSLIAYTENGESGHATSRRDINGTGLKAIIWSGGSAVSANVLTLNPGKYWECHTTSSAALKLGGWGSVTWDAVLDDYRADNDGYTGSMTTGSPPAWVASWSGNLTRSGGGAERINLVHLGVAP